MKIKVIKGVRKITKKSILRYGSKGRPNLGEIAKGVSSCHVRKEENGQIILTPFVEIPLSEKWILIIKRFWKRLNLHLTKIVLSEFYKNQLTSRIILESYPLC